MRIGHGFDVHKFGGENPLIIAGTLIPNHIGLLAHSDGDVALHALTDALLGAVALGDIGTYFPDTDPAYKNVNSQFLLQEVYKKVIEKGFKLINIDITIIAQTPKLLPFIIQMRECIAKVLNSSIENINIKATTTEKLGFIGRKEGIACEVVVLVEKFDE